MPSINVSLKDGADASQLDAAKKQVTEQGGKITTEFKLIKGFTAEFPEDKAHTLSSNDHINVENDGETQKVTDGEVARLAGRPLHPLTLADLAKSGRPPLTADQLLDSANFTLSILPSRLAHRIQSLRNLPFIVVSNPNVSKIHNNYVHSLSTLLPYASKEIKTL
ncbi:hypothetical protein KCU79_g21687, partial [Aureobasidium melanogenum]